MCRRARSVARKAKEISFPGGEKTALRRARPPSCTGNPRASGLRRLIPDSNALKNQRNTLPHADAHGAQGVAAAAAGADERAGVVDRQPRGVAAERAPHALDAQVLLDIRDVERRDERRSVRDWARSRLATEVLGKVTNVCLL